MTTLTWNIIHHYGVRKTYRVFVHIETYIYDFQTLCVVKAWPKFKERKWCFVKENNTEEVSEFNTRTSNSWGDWSTVTVSHSVTQKLVSAVLTDQLKQFYSCLVEDFYLKLVAVLNEWNDDIIFKYNSVSQERKTESVFGLSRNVSFALTKFFNNRKVEEYVAEVSKQCWSRIYFVQFGVFYFCFVFLILFFSY